jgi:hypothetical protein
MCVGSGLQSMGSGLTSTGSGLLSCAHSAKTEQSARRLKAELPPLVPLVECNAQSACGNGADVSNGTDGADWRVCSVQHGVGNRSAVSKIVCVFRDRSCGSRGRLPLGAAGAMAGCAHDERTSSGRCSVGALPCVVAAPHISAAATVADAGCASRSPANQPWRALDAAQRAARVAASTGSSTVFVSAGGRCRLQAISSPRRIL